MHDAADWILDALSLPDRPRSRWHRAGIGPRGEKVLDVAGGLLLFAFAAGWIWTMAVGDVASASAATLRPGGAGTAATAAMAAALTHADAPTTAYLMDATLDVFSGERGASGKLRVGVTPAGNDTLGPDSLPSGARVRYTEAGDVAPKSEPQGAGVWRVAIELGNAIRPITDFSVITLVPSAARHSGRIGLYYIGTWPTESGRRAAPAKAPPERYAPPKGFIEVTPENADTRVSEHFRLSDFLTHDQQGVWPKYLVLELRLVDKLELVLTDLSQHGVNVSGVKIMSGFRTPQYNRSGGNPAGRAGLSRHMYGDAADIYIDDDGNGSMDDLNHDGRVTIEDARVIEAAVDRVESAHPELVGGAGVYVAAPGHGPFIHIDTRGYRARWVSTGGD